MTPTLTFTGFLRGLGGKSLIRHEPGLYLLNKFRVDIILIILLQASNEVGVTQHLLRRAPVVHDPLARVVRIRNFHRLREDEGEENNKGSEGEGEFGRISQKKEKALVHIDLDFEIST